jgi:hypothetical protein
MHYGIGVRTRQEVAIMGAGTSKTLYTPSWKELYQLAVYEPDLTKLPERIADAEAALVLRARELFYSSGNGVEEESLDDAMYILHALRNSLDRRSRSIHGKVNPEESIIGGQVGLRDARHHDRLDVPKMLGGIASCCEASPTANAPRAQVTVKLDAADLVRGRLTKKTARS